MTTPPPPGGWYPDPDGSGGQRYWDGYTWTEHRAPATPPPPPAAEPAPPATPAAPPGSEQPTAVVPTFTPPAGAHGGAHRRPEPEPEREREPEPEPEPEPSVRATEPVAQRFTPEPPPGPPPPGPPPPGPPPSAPPSFDAPRSFDAQSSFNAQPSFNAPAPSPADDGRKKLIIGFFAACAVLLVALVAAVIYGFVIREDPGVQLATPGETTTAEESESPSTTESSEATETETATPPTVAEGGAVTDGSLSFVVHGFEVGSTVVSSSAPIEKNAQGEYVVVHMTVTNNSDTATTFIATFQTLNAGGTTYNIDDEATFYLDSGLAELAPGASADASIAFDVPPGTVPESVMLHVDPMSPGVEVPLA